jgi:hypothetical protein
VDPRASNWVRGLDLNPRPSGYEPNDALSTCYPPSGATDRDEVNMGSVWTVLLGPNPLQLAFAIENLWAPLVLLGNCGR